MLRINIGDPKLGIWIYKEAIENPKRITSILNEKTSKSNNPTIQWRQALVGRNETMLSYRNCWDCKLTPIAVANLGSDNQDFIEMYSDLVLALGRCVEDYVKEYNFQLRYMEAVNFVKYEVGEHFDVHSDHGLSYSCVVSSIAYLNDDYEGGELWFKFLDKKIFPQAGDIVVFPSTFIYSHASLPVKTGVKYSAVTMFDYNDANHKVGGYAT